MTEQIKIADITTEHPARYAHIVEHYRLRLAAGEILKPILVKRSSHGLVSLVDGHHRFEAHRLAGRDQIDACVWSVN